MNTFYLAVAIVVALSTVLIYGSLFLLDQMGLLLPRNQAVEAPHRLTAIPEGSIRGSDYIVLITGGATTPKVASSASGIFVPKQLEEKPRLYVPGKFLRTTSHADSFLRQLEAA